MIYEYVGIESTFDKAGGSKTKNYIMLLSGALGIQCLMRFLNLPSFFQVSRNVLADFKSLVSSFLIPQARYSSVKMEGSHHEYQLNPHFSDSHFTILLLDSDVRERRIS